MKLLVQVLVQRNPVTLKPLSAFDKAYLQYRDALLLKTPGVTKPFQADNFFKRGSLLQTKWLALHADIPHSSPSSPSPSSSSADDELAGVMQTIEATDAVMAERNADLKSLDRRLSDPVFLTIKSKNLNAWSLPGLMAPLPESELLHEAAKRGLEETCGQNMELWNVGQVPIGHISNEKEKTFIMKQLILSGQVELNTKIASDHAWLTKEEMSTHFDKGYFESIKDLI
ncbi:54S ribosomal protein L17 mitochondrial [Chytriomyces hyalinus]|nr:54S ribosomal protein L17 mitochondrial [Chytriomyces hyalinus]